MNAPRPIRTCPDRNQLLAFSQGNLPADDLEAFADHLVDCPRCQATVQSLPQADDELLALRRLKGATATALETLLEREIASLEQSGLADFAITTPGLREKPPQRLREYQLLDKLGEGGMGAVYKAVHTRLDKVVAVKPLPSERMNDATAVARFQREMKAIGQLSHPNIVGATDAGEVDGTHFLVMEYVEGSDLAKLLRRHGPLSVADACEVIRQAALGLQHAHEHGLVHRDVKPSNLMVAGDVVKILDLGLARLQGAAPAGELSTASGVVLGTFDYVAPEQGDDPHAADHRADLYSLGCTLYHLLVGQPPFPSLQYRTPLQKLKAHAMLPPPSVRSRRPDVPESLARILDKLLVKNPAQRTSSAAAVAEAMRPFTRGCNLARLIQEPSPTKVNGSGPSPRPRRPRWLSLAVATVASLFLIALLGAVVIYVQTDKGLVEVVTDDDNVKVSVERGGKQILVIDPQANKEYRLSTGEYQLKLIEDGQERELRPNHFTLSRGGKEIVVVRRIGKPEPGTAPEQKWLDLVAKLPPDRQVEEVVRELQRRNPEFNGEVKPTIEDGAVTGLELHTDHVTDIWPVRGLPRLTKLVCQGTEPKKGKLTDLSPLKGTAVTWLDCANNAIHDLTPLTGVRLKVFICPWGQFKDLTPLKDMPLEVFHCAVARVEDLTPLQNCPLKELILQDTKVTDLTALSKIATLVVLNCSDTLIKDLKPLAGLRLVYLNCVRTDISNLEPLKGMPLSGLLCSETRITSLEPLRGMETLQHLQCFLTGVRDLAALEGLPIDHLDCGDTQVKDLTPVKDMPLGLLAFGKTRVTDLTPLKDKEIVYLVYDLNLPRDAAILRSLKKLEAINSRPAAEVLKEENKQQ